MPFKFKAVGSDDWAYCVTRKDELDLLEMDTPTT